MPREWHDRHSVNKFVQDEQRSFYRSIIADKKPYFMRYIYPALMKQYNAYIKNTDRNALREFQMTVSELKSIPHDELTDRQKDFIKYYDYRMPVGTNDCVMNKICKRFEQEFDGYVGRHNSSVKFDCSIMKSDAQYTQKQFNTIKRLYEEYNKRLSSYAVFADYEKVDECELCNALAMMDDEFRKECDVVCPDRYTLCNIILDICYTRSSTKRFAWSMCGSEIIHNLLKSNGYEIHYPTLDDDGDISYCGNSFTVCSTVLDGD